MTAGSRNFGPKRGYFVCA